MKHHRTISNRRTKRRVGELKLSNDRFLFIYSNLYILCLGVLCASYFVFLSQPRGTIHIHNAVPIEDRKGDIFITKQNKTTKTSSESTEVFLQRNKDKPSQVIVEKFDEGSSYLTMFGEHRVKPALEQLPRWLSDYFAWHQDQVANANDDTKYLVVTCLGKDRHCGGFSDRFRGLPCLLFVASKVNRVLCIYWSKPFGLEHLLQPPKGGMDWRCPAEFDSMVDKTKRSTTGQKFKHNLMYGYGTMMNGEEGTQVTALMISKIKKNHEKYTGISYTNQGIHKINSANNVFNAYSYRERMPIADKWFHVDLSEHIYRVMFEPIEPIARSINATMTRLGLVENNYTAVHVRGRYPTRRLHYIMGPGNKAKDHDKGNTDSLFEGKYKEYLVKLANNALDCGSRLNPDNQLFFISDSADLTNYVLENPVTLGQDKKLKIPGRIYQPISFGERDKINHLNKNMGAEEIKYADYYPIIEDLLIMGGSNCVAHGVGSFGAFGASLSGNRCRALHQNPDGGMIECPNARQFKFIKTIDESYLLPGYKIRDNDDGLVDPAVGYFYEDEQKLQQCIDERCDLADPAYMDFTQFAKISR